MTKMTFLLLVALGFCEMCVNTGALKLAKPVITGPSSGLLHNVTDFYCIASEKPQNVSVLYQLFGERDMKKVLGHYTAHSGEAATFPSVLTLYYDGRLTCKASGHNNSDIEPSYSDWLEFRVIDPVVGPFIILNPPGDLWAGESLTLQCNISKGNYVSYSWFFNDMPVETIDKRFQNRLTIQRLSTRNTGEYVCLVSNQLHDTLTFNNRSIVTVRVKEDVSKPEISYDVYISEAKNLTANVTCKLTKGTPPINFTLLIGSQILTQEHVEDLSASFTMPVFLYRDMGLVQCQASNGKSLMKSEKLNLTVEPVGGDVTMRVKKGEGPFFQVIGVWIHCSVERGTFPLFSWFLNNSKLEGKGPFYTVFGKGDSGLALSLGQRSAGIYHCEAGNKFDNATSLRSQKILITKEALNRVPVLVVALVFTCFSLLIVAVTACCLYGILRRKRASNFRRLKLYFPETSNVVDDDEEDDYENEEGMYDNEESKYDDEEDDVGVVGEYREDTVTEQSSTTEDSDEGEEEGGTHKHKDSITE